MKRLSALTLLLFACQPPLADVEETHSLVGDSLVIEVTAEGSISQVEVTIDASASATYALFASDVKPKDEDLVTAATCTTHCAYKSVGDLVPTRNVESSGVLTMTASGGLGIGGYGYLTLVRTDLGDTAPASIDVRWYVVSEGGGGCEEDPDAPTLRRID